MGLMSVCAPPSVLFFIESQQLEPAMTPSSSDSFRCVFILFNINLCHFFAQMKACEMSDLTEYGRPWRCSRCTWEVEYTRPSAPLTHLLKCFFTRKKKTKTCNMPFLKMDQDDAPHKWHSWVGPPMRDHPKGALIRAGVENVINLFTGTKITLPWDSLYINIIFR